MSRNSKGRSSKKSQQNDVTSIRLKPKVKKNISKFIPLVKFAVLVFVLYFASQWMVRKIWGQNLKPAKNVSATAVQYSPSPVRTILPRQQQISHEKPVVSVYKAPPPAKSKVLFPNKPKLVIVLDDMGHTSEHVDLLKNLGDKVTYAILPLLAKSKFFSQLSRKTGAEVILHQPFEAEDGTIPGPGLITSRMTGSHLRETLERNLMSVPEHRGVNNHMGSLGTSDPDLMRAVLHDLKDKQLFFLDSQTTSRSVAQMIGRQIGIPVLERDVFLDNIDEPSAIRKQLELLAMIAAKNGFAVGIGHYRYNTLYVLNREIPRLEKDGFQFIALSDLVKVRKS